MAARDKATADSLAPSPSASEATHRCEHFTREARGDLEPGLVIDDKYVLREKLGAGGMGVVYAALDQRLDREVAIKVIYSSAASDPELAVKIGDEGRAMAKLRHPNVMEIYDVGSYEDRPYMVMPLCPGQNLLAWVSGQGRGPISPPVAIGIIGQACAGAKALHGIGLVHHDIKPTNIIMSPSYEVILADLGLTRRRMEHEPTEDFTGTVGFVAPEYLGTEPVPSHLAHKTDIYALGVTTYWLLTRRMPTGKGTFREILDKQLAGDILPPSEVRPELPKIFDRIVLRALQLDPSLRPEAAEFQAELFKARDAHPRADVERQRFILVVDDDPAALKLTAEYVASSSEAEVVTTTDPKAALSIIESRPPDLVISDLEMPDINGVELVASVRGNPRTCKVPIVMVTGVGGAKDWNLLRSIGVDRFLLKPIDPQVLRDTIGRVLS